MNIQEADILRTLKNTPFVNQRVLSETTGHSLGVVNRSLKQLMKDGCLNASYQLTEKAESEIRKRTPANAIILAAGFGMRMVPINSSTPKAFLEVKGERLIERLIRQLHDSGIRDITVVVGFMAESFEYLIDDFGVDLVVNEAYASRNNLHSLALAADHIHNTYILPCDIWCGSNPFRSPELYSWYMVSDSPDEDSDVRINRKMELIRVREKETGNSMIGIACVLEPEAETLRKRLAEMDADPAHDADYWEEALYEKDRMILRARAIKSQDIIEINTYEQLRSFDASSNQLRSDAIAAIAEALHCRQADVVDISVLKKGMTNRSFLFSVKGSKYIMRIPGEGTDRLIDRRQEADVFRAVSGHGLCDDPVFIDPETGYKITKFLEGVRVCDPANESDLERCMEKLRTFHEMHLQVNHTFDLFGQISFYESLWEGTPSVYRDYPKTKENVLSLQPYIDSLEKDWCLTHIDAVPDNFLFYPDGNQDETRRGAAGPDGTGEALQLTDWEYAGMQDPHVDIAMFCIYCLYDKTQCDHLIDIYFKGNCDKQTRAKIYCYIAACGLLWSNWCEYKRKLGVEFGEYSLRQYRYAKDFYRYAIELMETDQRKGAIHG